jgi:osmoprotectant transport system permease protein
MLKWLVAFTVLIGLSTPAQSTEIVIGSKKFTESVILGEILTGLARDVGLDATHRSELGGTRVVFEALLGGDIDLYVEYTGTLKQEILVNEHIRSDSQLRQALAAQGVAMTAPIGFNNTYAIGMTNTLATRLGVSVISDLQGHPDLKFGFGNEFMNRADGWPALQQTYGLPQRDVRGLDHDLAYRGLDSGAIDVMDLYSTDAKIAQYNVAVLEDDLGLFPRYDAIILYRQDLTRRAPELVAAFARLEGSVDEQMMMAMNAAVVLEGKSEKAVVEHFLHPDSASNTNTGSQIWSRLWTNTIDHLVLVGISLGGAIILAVPLGIAAYRRPRLGQVILGVSGIVQTIPSLALFVFMIPLLGIGGPPAIVALFLYSLLPIIRSTHTGLADIPQPLRESAEALGLPKTYVLRKIELPLSARSIMSGIKTAAIINVGTASLGALIGAGGYGQPILTGIRLDDMSLILQGAIPAALLALLTQGLFELLERAVVPKGLHLQPTTGGA